MKVWDRILAQFKIEVTTTMYGANEVIYMVDPDAILVKKGAYIFRHQIVTKRNKQEKILYYKQKIATKIIENVFQ